MGDKEDYLTSYRLFFENFAATVNPEDQLPVHIAGYTITEAELPGEVLYWTTQYLTEKQCPQTLMTPLRRIILDEVRIECKKQPNEFGYEPDKSVYIALRLMQAVTACVNDVCLRYLDNSRLDSLPPPPPLAQRELKTVSAAAKNSRRVMEDRHAEIGNLETLFGIETTEPTSFYAVYDGHAGSAAATYCAAHLHQYLVESSYFTSDLRKALLDAFLRTDTEFVRKSNQEGARGGSTAVAVTVRGRRLHAAWAGDSLALLAKRMRLMQLVCPHKPGRQDEKDRIESSGGTVLHWDTWRVNGQLAVSRAIGDADYKPYVTARPEIATVELDGDEDFVVVACDGLWDFVSEDDVALAVYRQLATDPDDLKAVTKRLIVQAKKQGSCDNISVIVVFLKDPRDIAADNRPPMDLGLDNALANAQPFAVDMEACKRQLDVAAADANGAGECADADAEAEPVKADNGVDNSDSDSEDLGPETAVDADDIDAETRNHEPAPPTPPAHTVEEGHVDGALVDNVAAESGGDESEDEWNYFKGEGGGEGHNRADDTDEPPRSDTPCQDNSAWESSSVDMNSSPLNPDAPVFVPGSVAGADVLLAESPRKPLPMDDIELPDVAQFQTEAVVRPAELLDLDNCDQLNGHHNLSLNEADKEHFNGNDKCNMDSLGFGFGVGVESEKIKDTSLIQDFERIQKDTTDFVNIQVFQTHTEGNPFAAEGNDEFLERLKNKERDPMSMSFYQEKDDDTCERLSKNDTHVDLNAVQLLPDSDDEDIQPNGDCENYNENEKENIYPEEHSDLLGQGDNQEPNNDIMRLDDRTDLVNDVANFGQGDNFMAYNTNNMQNYPIDFESCNVPQETVLQTDTPESHKLLFEQIPEIPDGKSSELGFTNEDLLDPSESEKEVRAGTPQDETSQDIEMESKIEDSPSVETQPELTPESKEEHIESTHISEKEQVASPEPILQTENNDNEITSESLVTVEAQLGGSTEQLSESPILGEHKVADSITPEPAHDLQENVIAEIHQTSEPGRDNFDINVVNDFGGQGYDPELTGHFETPSIQVDSDIFTTEPAIAQDTATIVESPIPVESPAPLQSPLPTSESPVPIALSPAPVEISVSAESPVPPHSPLPTESPLPASSPLPTDALTAHSPVPAESPLPQESLLPTESLVTTQSPLPTESPVPAQSPLPTESLLLTQSPLPTESPVPAQIPLPAEAIGAQSPLPTESPLPTHSPLPSETLLPAHSPQPTELRGESPLPAEVPLPRESPVPSDSPLPTESPLPVESLPVDSSMSRESPAPAESHLPKESLPLEISQPRESPLPIDSALRPQTASPHSTSPFPSEVPLPTEATPLAASPTHLESDEALESRLTPDVAQEQTDVALQHEPMQVPESITGPTPDIVPDEREDLSSQTHSEIVTDIDIGIPESRAQEICVPVTSEIHQDDAVHPGTATPPPTPAIDPAQPSSIPLLSDTPIAADTAAVTDKSAEAVVAAAVGAVAVAAAATAALKSKTPASKKPPTTPTLKPTSKSSTTTPRTPASATKKPTSATPAKTTLSATKQPLSATKTTATSATKTTAASARLTAAKPGVPKAPTPKLGAKSSPAPIKESPVTAKSATQTRAAPAARPAATKPAAARPATAKPAPARPAATTVTAATKAPAARPTAAAAPKSAPARPAAAPRPASAARPTPRPAPTTKPKEVASKAPEKKPLTNGDVKAPAPIRKPAPTAARPAPRPATRVPPATAAPAATAKSAAPKPAPRATRPALDKQTKDLANKRITGKAAPPRTAATKVTSVSKNASKPEAEQKSLGRGPPASAPLANGSAEALSKPPPSPPAADNALLPDVIA